MRSVKKTTPMDIIIKLLKSSGKEKILKAPKDKSSHYVQRNKDKDGIFHEK